MDCQISADMTEDRCRLKRNGGDPICRYCNVHPMTRTVPVTITFEEFDMLKEAAQIDGIPMDVAGGMVISQFFRKARAAIIN